MRLINHEAIAFHRVGGLDLTTRFTDEEFPQIDESDWKVGSKAVEIVFSSGSTLESSILVREFVPRYGDVTGRRYTDGNGNHQWINLPAYGLIDPAAYLGLICVQIPNQACHWAATQGRAHKEALRLIDAGIVSTESHDPFCHFPHYAFLFSQIKEEYRTFPGRGSENPSY